MVFLSFLSEAVNVPLIPLGLKETKEVDFTVSIQVNIYLVKQGIIFIKYLN